MPFTTSEFRQLRQFCNFCFTSLDCRRCLHECQKMRGKDLKNWKFEVVTSGKDYHTHMSKKSLSTSHTRKQHLMHLQNIIPPLMLYQSIHDKKCYPANPLNIPSKPIKIPNKPSKSCTVSGKPKSVHQQTQINPPSTTQPPPTDTPPRHRP